MLLAATSPAHAAFHVVGPPTTRGTLATVDGSLKVKGSDQATQILRLGESGRPVTIKGDVKRESDPLNVTVTSELVVGKTVSLSR